jgi:hypothetical protein
MEKEKNSSGGVLLSRFDCDIQYCGKKFLEELWDVERVDLLTADDPVRLFFHDIDDEEIDHLSVHIQSFLDGANEKRLVLAGGLRPDVLTNEEVRRKVARAVGHLQLRFPSVSVEGLFVDQKTGVVDRII